MRTKLLFQATSCTALAVGLAVTGCTGTSGEPTDSPTPGVNRPTATEPVEPAPETTPPQTPSNPTFGESYAYSDGLQVTASTPQAFQPSDTAAYERAPAYMTFTVMIVNGTQTNYDATLFSATAQSANIEANQIFDSANSLGGPPSTTVLPGREAEFRIGFSVADPKDIVLEITPGFAYESAIFTS